MSDRPGAVTATHAPPDRRSGGRPRAVVLVPNTAAPYSRGLRIARSLAGEGYDVEIAALAGPGVPREERDGAVVLRRYGAESLGAVGGRNRRGERSLASYAGYPVRKLRWIVGWSHLARPWRAALRQGLASADVYHACGYLAIAAALELSRAARRQGRDGRVVYDVIDVVLESNNYARVPRPLLAAHRLRERRWARRADAIVTVNDAIADYLVGSWSLRERPTVLLNAQPRWQPPPERPDFIRAATGIPRGRRVVLFLGRLGRERGLEEAAEAVLRLPDAALVMLGFGPWADELRERGREPRFRGRHFVLPPVHPDQVPAWTASADVSIIAVPANSLNQRLSTPNKFWESLTAGTPVVVGSGLEVMRGIVEQERLGAVADPHDPGDLARALHAVLEQPAAEAQAMRQRCLTVTRERFNWETSVQPYLRLVRSLARSA